VNELRRVQLSWEKLVRLRSAVLNIASLLPSVARKFNSLLHSKVTGIGGSASPLSEAWIVGPRGLICPMNRVTRELRTGAAVTKAAMTPIRWLIFPVI